jgi:hypothetical protein
MPSQFSALGFDARSGEDLAALASKVAARAESIFVEGGEYLRWSPASGEQLWLQLKKNGDAMGMNPHFAGKGRVRALVEGRVARDSHTPLDGTFLAWANPIAGEEGSGDYPFVFDCPDAAQHASAALPLTVDVQVAAFAQNATLHLGEREYHEAQASQGMSFGLKAFIPSGLVSPTGEPVSPPEPHALISGLILEAEERHNAITGNAFFWALLDTLGGTYDAIIDPELLSHRPSPGNVLSGWFWLSGRIQAATTTPKRGWFGRISGG